eukprot:7137001-Ditylum_brightwellii.AAC.2
MLSQTDKCKELERIDTELTEAMCGPEKEVPVPHKAWWSNTLRYAHIVVQYWKTEMSLQKSNQQDESILQDIANKLGPDQDIHQGSPHRPVSSQLQKAIKVCKTCCNNSYKL